MVLLAVVFVTASVMWALSPGVATAATVCPPVTLEDLITPPEPPATTVTYPTTVTPPATTVTPPATTVTTPATTVTSPTTTVTSPTTTVTPPTTTVTPPTTTVTAPPVTEPPCDTPFVYSMTFPVLGGGGIGSPFGADRDGGRRLHAGNDIFAAPMQPIVAVSGGTVIRIGYDVGISGNLIAIRHDDGWSSFYIHLNNDSFGTDDGNGVGVRPDLTVGTRVEAGEVIGWNGDSGNAEGSTQHLHFELHNPAGQAVDPGPSLRAARKPGTPTSVDHFDGPFADILQSEGPADPITFLLSRGAPTWCGDEISLACPEDPATHEDVSAWLSVLIGPVVVESAPPESGLPALRECETHLTCLPDPIPPAASTCPVDGCEEPAVDEFDIAAAIVWDRLRDAHEIGGITIQPGVPDAAWTTPVLPPPDHTYDVAVGDVEELISAAPACSAAVAPDQGLTRAQAAARIVELLGFGPDQCDVRTPATAAPKR